MATPHRICPYCGSDFSLSACPVVSTAEPVSVEFDDFDRDDLGANAGLEHRRGGFPVLWEPRPPTPPTTRARGVNIFTQGAAQLVSDVVPLSRFPTEKLARRLCPNCEEPLPPDLDTRDAHIIGVAGLTFSGKTYYLGAALTQAVRKRGLAATGCVQFSPDDETSERLHQDYYLPMFRQNERLRATQIDVEIKKKPLTFQVSYPGVDPYLLMTHDVSGEVVSNHRQRATVTPFIRRADGLIFLVDPVEFDVVRGRLPDTELPPAERSLHQTDLLASCLRELEAAGRKRVPVAITISKSDLLARAVGGEHRFTRATSEDDWVGDVRATSAEVRQLLLDLGEGDLVSVADAHGNATFHAVSALGFGASGANGASVAPLRCLDPLGTLLLRLNFALR